MKNIFILSFFIIPTAFASIVGISTHPLSDEARVLTAEMTGYMSRRHEMGMGLRYTQEIAADQMLDISASGGQDSRSLIMGAGMDFAILREDVYQPRFSMKTYLQHQKFEDLRATLIGVAPTLRKGLSVQGVEFFPFLAIPAGIRVNNENDEFDYYASLSLGASLPFPGANTDKLLLSVEGNMDMGSSSDYVGCLISWVWH